MKTIWSSACHTKTFPRSINLFDTVPIRSSSSHKLQRTETEIVSHKHIHIYSLVEWIVMISLGLVWCSYVFERSLLRSSRLHLFDRFNIILKWHLILWWQTWIVSIITLFRSSVSHDHSVCWFGAHVFHYYKCWKQICCLIC